MAGPGLHCGDSLSQLVKWHLSSGQCSHLRSDDSKKQKSVASLISLLFQVNCGPISGLACLGPTKDEDTGGPSLGVEEWKRQWEEDREPISFKDVSSTLGLLPD